MLYYLVRPLARYVLRYYYRRIDITGLEHIPRDAAVILAANHPTAFIEPCLLACFQPRPLHFLARGDLYKNKLADWVLRALHILPVYRMEDGGYGKLTENYDTFEACHAVLSRRRAIMILAEGRCIHEKRLRPLRKGTARVALGALEADATLPEVYIVPVGVNFVAAETVRSTVMIRCGEPLRASDYLDRYRDNQNIGLRELTDDLRRVLSPLIVQLAPEWETSQELRLERTRNDLDQIDLPGLTHRGAQLNAELAVATGTGIDSRDAEAYAAALAFHRTCDRAVSASARAEWPWQIIPATVLLLPHLPLWLLAEHLAKRNPRTIEFYSPVRFAAIAVGTILYLPVFFLLGWPLRIYLLLSVLSVRWSLRQVDRLRRWREDRRFSQLGPDKQRRLRELRQRV
jgi:1-acyl-sn-glycerol-3-phosphate acyltransferase